jgi:hypothetical protein
VSRSNPWFYRADGGLDLGQFICFAFTIFSCVAFWEAGANKLTITPEAWAFLGACQIVVFVAWASRERAEWLAKRGMPTIGGSVAE